MFAVLEFTAGAGFALVILGSITYLVNRNRHRAAMRNMVYYP